MKLTIVGATGGVGRHLVDQALEAGHCVTAAVRNPAALPVDVPHAWIDLGDPDERALEAAVGEADAVLSGLGPRGRHEYGIVSGGTAAIVAAMRSVGSRRIVAISGAGVSTARTPDRPDPPRREVGAGLFNHYIATPMARRVLGEHFTDVAAMEDVLRASGLDWTAVRAPLLTNGALRRRYRTSRECNVRRGLRLSRADAAHFMLQTLDQPSTVGTAVAVAY